MRHIISARRRNPLSWPATAAQTPCIEPLECRRLLTTAPTGLGGETFTGTTMNGQNWTIDFAQSSSQFTMTVTGSATYDVSGTYTYTPGSGANGSLALNGTSTDEYTGGQTTDTIAISGSVIFRSTGNPSTYNFTDQDQESSPNGTDTTTSSGSYTFTYSGSSSGSEETTPTPTIEDSTIPTTVSKDSKGKGDVTVELSNSDSSTLKEKATVALYLTSDSNSIKLKSDKVHLKIGADGTSDVKIGVSKFPKTVTAGTYTLTVIVTDANGTAAYTNGPTITVT